MMSGIYILTPTSFSLYQYIYKRAAAYRGVPGYRYSIEEWRDAKDAIRTAGLD